MDETYVDAMQEREKLITTYMGMGVAIPHGTSQAKGTVKKTGIVFLQYPEGVDFGDEKAQLVFGIAGIGDEHLDLLAKICEVLEDEEGKSDRITGLSCCTRINSCCNLSSVNIEVRILQHQESS